MTDYLRQTHHEFLAASEAALADPRLQQILGQLGDTLGRRNREAWAALPNSDLIRERARAIKDQTLAELDQHLGRLERAVTARGGHVHWADDGAEACKIIVGLIRERQATKVVKSKSMTTEEIHLNHALEEAGIEAVETDLGEYIIQLAEHRPSHIVAPAIHLSAQEIADILSKPAGERLPAERQVLAQFARRA